MIFGKDSISDLLQFCGEHLKASELAPVYEIKFDCKISFETHINILCSKASQKLGVLQTILNLLD